MVEYKTVLVRLEGSLRKELTVKVTEELNTLGRNLHYCSRCPLG